MTNPNLLRTDFKTECRKAHIKKIQIVLGPEHYTRTWTEDY